MDAKIFRINYKSDFILTLESDAGWMTPFCIKFWTGAPAQAYYVGWDGTTYDHCSFDPSEPTKLQVQFDDHHLPVGDLKYQVAYHFTVADFPNDTEDEVLNQANITTEIDGDEYQVMLDFTGETAPEIQFSLPAYANEAQRIANEAQRIAAEQTRIANEETRIANEQTRINQEQARQQNEQQRINQEQARVNEYAALKADAVAATGAANDAAALANQKAQLAADKAALADAAATLANAKAQLAADKAALAASAAQLANDKAALAQQKAEYANTQGGYAKDQGDYAKDQGDYAKAQGDTALADHQRAESDHGIAVDDHTQAGNDHTRAESDHGIATADHTLAAADHVTAGNDHTTATSDHGIASADHTLAAADHAQAESDHTRAESDHAAVEVYVDSLGAYDISAANASGGVLATYADLTAALGTGGANIPELIRKGGMSVKFVRSSDNNYTQYTLAKNEWSVYAADWFSAEKIASLAHKDDYVKYEGFASSGHGASIRSNLTISDQGVITGGQPNAYYVVLAKNPFKKGDIIHYDGVATGNRGVKICFSREDLIDLDKADLVGKQLIGNSESGFDVYYDGTNHNWDIVVPEDNLYLVYFYREQNWSSKVWTIYTHIVDSEPTAGSRDLINSGGVANKGMLYHFVGAGSTYVSFECGKIIAGHTYRVYPIVKEWSWGTTLSTANIFEIRYKNSNGDFYSVYSQKYGSGSPAIPDYVEVTIPSNILEGSGLFIGGRASLGTKVYFTIEDITYSKERLDKIGSTLWDYSFVKDAVSKKLYAQNYTDNKRINTIFSIVNDNNCFISDYIPCVENDVITWIYSGSGAHGSGAICCYNASKESLNAGWANITGGTRTVTNSNTGCVYIRVTFVKEEGYNPAVYINGVLAWIKEEDGVVEELDKKMSEFLPSFPAYGEIGKNYGNQIPDIVDKLNYRFSNRFHFLHLSDNHNSIYGYANEFLDYIPAKFLVNTGDMVNDKFSDSKTNTIACSISPTKPVYLVLGNHDYSHATSKQDVFDAFFGDDETEGTVNYHNVQTGGVATDKTYYSIDFATEGVKCIMLDLNEGHTDEELPDLNPNSALYGSMSQTQIEWFIAQLQDAITNSLHVCIFIHALPSKEKPNVFSKIIDNFMDNNYAGKNSNGLSLTTCYRLSFLLDIVDAFINGESVTFTYNDHEYTFTFASAGHFVAWFAGHTHSDCCGWLTGHEQQFAINVCRPTPNSGGSLGTYDGDKLGVHFNYVTIDTGLNSLSVYRVGQQNTVYATQRKSFRILYK